MESNNVIVTDIHCNDYQYAPPKGYKIEILTKEDGSILIQAFPVDTVNAESITLAVWAHGHWANSYLVEVE